MTCDERIICIRYKRAIDILLEGPDSLIRRIAKSPQQTTKHYRCKKQGTRLQAEEPTYQNFTFQSVTFEFSR